MKILRSEQIVPQVRAMTNKTITKETRQGEMTQKEMTQKEQTPIQ
jgi:hypothetical protein